MKLYLVFLFVLAALTSFGQSMSFHADVMINADHADHRTYAANKFAAQIKELLDSEDSFQNNLAEIPWVSIQYPRDSSFRLISWQIDKGEGLFEYKGFFQSDVDLISFGSPNEHLRDDNSTMSLEDWGGGLVYKIISLPETTDTYYLLSFKQLDQFTKAKSLEPLKIGNSGIPMIGVPGLFKKEENAKSLSKLSLTYSSDVNAGFTIDEQSKRIVFDNLVLVQGRLQGQGPTYVPDGSYKAYQLEEDSSWTFVDKLYNQWNDGPLDPEFVKNRKEKVSRKDKN